jgi:hypothetical protein
MSTKFAADEIACLIRFLSAERLKSLIELTGSEQSAIELHQETLALGAQLMGVVATIEISLRNSVCNNLSQHFGVDTWLLQPPIPFQWKEPEKKKAVMAQDSAQRAEYSKLNQVEKTALDACAYPHGRPPNTSHAKRSKDRRKHIQLPTGKVVAELTLYFWKRLYGPEYEQTLWRPTLKRTFPNKNVKRADIAINLEKIYQARNRLAHHEPVLHKRFDETILAIEYISENLEATIQSTALPLPRLIADDLLRIKAQANELHDKLTAYKK